MTESTFGFDCRGDTLVGLLHRPDPASTSARVAQASTRGVLFVVGGGPQYRTGGHRQLTLWARALSAQGFPAFRFDYRGMGDAQGRFQGFEAIDADICAAIDEFFARVPTLTEVVLWGECDAASAILFYAHRDARVKGLVLLNPWVRTPAGEAQTILRFYYAQRLLQASFWKKVLGLRFNPLASLASAWRLLQRARRPAPGAVPARQGSLPERLLQGMTNFQGPVLLVLSGRDLIAREFDGLVSGASAWQTQFVRKPVTRHDLPEGDHTFSSALQRQQVVSWGLSWLRNW